MLFFLCSVDVLGRVLIGGDGGVDVTTASAERRVAATGMASSAISLEVEGLRLLSNLGDLFSTYRLTSVPASANCGFKHQEVGFRDLERVESGFQTVTLSGPVKAREDEVVHGASVGFSFSYLGIIGR
jgi:hypothetical protein